MTTAPAFHLAPAPAEYDDVLPERITIGTDSRGPRFADNIWDFRPFVARTVLQTRIDFTTLTDDIARRTVKEYLYSRIRRGTYADHGTSRAKPLKITNAYREFNLVRVILRTFRELGADRLSDVTQAHLQAALAEWKGISLKSASDKVTVLKHLAAQGSFLGEDRLTVTPWPGRGAKLIVGLGYAQENTTRRIPEEIIIPLLKAAVFYIDTASRDILAARSEVARSGHRRSGGQHGRCEATAEVSVPKAIWPDSGRPWRPGLNRGTTAVEITRLRTACWIVIAYLSGMRDTEVRELSRDCAFTEPGDDGRARYKLRGRVFKGRSLSGEEAEWVVLEIVHRAVTILTELNDDPTHLFGYRRGNSRYVLLRSMFERLNDFRDHVNALFSSDDVLFIPNDTAAGTGTGPGSDDGQDTSERPGAAIPWHFTPSQFRRTLAWHIAHQPFGVVAGARQYQHARIAIFEGYAGTSASGFAAEVAAEETVAKLDYLEDLYRDWNDGMRSGGGAAQRIDAEFERVRRELGDLAGVVASPARLRAMLAHLAKVLYPGTLNDCFHNPATALCAKRAKGLGRPLPLLDMCTLCPNARRSQVHLPHLITARDQARRELLPLAEDRKGKEPLAPLQRAALTEYVARFDRLIEELTPGETAGYDC